MIEGSIRPPFNHAWGYLDTKTVMDKHAHAHEEVYFVFEGEGFAVVGDERKPVGPGDVINIPSNVPHTMENAKDAPFLWAWPSGGIATRTPLPCAGRRQAEASRQGAGTIR